MKQWVYSHKNAVIVGGVIGVLSIVVIRLLPKKPVALPAVQPVERTGFTVVEVGASPVL